MHLGKAGRLNGYIKFCSFLNPSMQQYGNYFQNLCLGENEEWEKSHHCSYETGNRWTKDQGQNGSKENNSQAGNGDAKH